MESSKSAIADAVFAPPGPQEILLKRDILSPVRLNSLGQPSISSKLLHPSKPSRLSLHRSVPKPALVPDVFAAVSAESSFSSRPSSTTVANAKRVNDAGSLPASKRSKIDKGQVEVFTGKHKAEEEKWKSKWIRAFPSLVFHFEVGADASQRKGLIAKVTSMGAKVDQFLSRSTTHVIVKSIPSPSKGKAKLDIVRKSIPPRESPKNPFLDDTGATELVKKAEALNMKVWTEEKLRSMLTKLAPDQVTATDSLRTLLEDEKIHGTRERDLNAPRPDFFYFKPGSRYLLVEDATARHRTVMTKEYSAVPKDGAYEWPVLFESFLRPSSSVAHCTSSAEEIRDRAWSLYVDRKPYKGEEPPDLDRQTSMSSRAVATPEPSELAPYLLASGNSVTITSNIASTSATSNSPGIFTGPGFGPKDRALAQMSKRIQVLKGNAHLAATKRRASELQLASAPSSIRVPSQPNIAPKKVFMTQEQVLKMLQQIKAPVNEKPVSREKRIENHEKVYSGLHGRDQEVAAGYCENCRVRYTDLSVHITSKKHRRFATDPSNFASLDELLKLLVRPLNPAVFSQLPPVCVTPHGKDDLCDICTTGQFFSSQSSQSIGTEVDTDNDSQDYASQGSFDDLIVDDS